MLNLLYGRNHADEGRDFCYKYSHGIGNIASVRLPIAYPHAQFHHRLRGIDVVDAQNVEGSRSVKAKDAAEQSRIGFNKVDLLAASRGSSEVKLVHRFDPCHQQRTDHIRIGEDARGSKREARSRSSVDPADRDDAHVPGQRGIRMIPEIDVSNCMHRSLAVIGDLGRSPGTALTPNLSFKRTRLRRSA